MQRCTVTAFVGQPGRSQPGETTTYSEQTRFIVRGFTQRKPLLGLRRALKETGVSRNGYTFTMGSQ